LDFLFGPKLDISIKIADAESRRSVDVPRDNGKTEKLLLYVGDNDAVCGTVVLDLKSKKLEHTGIKLELIGQIELFYDRGNHFEFLSMEKELLPAGILEKSQEFQFDFVNAAKQHECYSGVNVRLRYFLRVTVARSLATNITKELDFWVHTYAQPPDVNNTIKMEVGIEDCLHIEFEYGKSKYHLKDVVIGKIYFLLVRIKIKHMEIALLKRETTGSGANVYNESETLTKFEIMDGAPVKGESIPVRLFLGGFELTPTYKSVENKFSLKYYLNLVLVDEEDRRYFKQQEITLWRKAPSGHTHSQPTQSYSGQREKEAAEEKDRRDAQQRAKLGKTPGETGAKENVADNHAKVQKAEKPAGDTPDGNPDGKKVKGVVVEAAPAAAGGAKAKPAAIPTPATAPAAATTAKPVAPAPAAAAADEEDDDEDDEEDDDEEDEEETPAKK